MARILRGDIIWADLNPTSDAQQRTNWLAPCSCTERRCFQPEIRHRYRCSFNQPTSKSRFPINNGTFFKRATKEIVGKN